MGDAHGQARKKILKSQHEKELLIEQLKRTPVVEVACQKSGVSRATYYRLLKEDPEFARKAEEALGEGTLLMNDMAESQLLAAIREKSLGAIVYWLKHHHPAYTTRVELNGRIIHQHEPLTPEQEELIREALRLAMPQNDLVSENYGLETQGNN